MDPIRLGIIGLGGRGRSLAHLLRTAGRHLFTIVGISDFFPGKVEAALRELELPFQAGHTDYWKLLANPGIEAVLVETGADTMAAVCCEALSAGKHVCADMPLVSNQQDCWDLIVAVERSEQQVYCMGEQLRFARFVTQWQELISQGEIGQPLFAQGECFRPDPSLFFEHRVTGQPDHSSIEMAASHPRYKKTWRNRLRHPIKYLPHGLSPLLKILDDRVARISCLSANAGLHGDGMEMLDLECALMQTDRGCTVRVTNSFTIPRDGKWAHAWYHLLGTDGVLECARPGWEEEGEIHFRRDGSVARTHYGWTPETASSGDPALGHGGLEACVFQHFYDAIRLGTKNELDIYTAMECALPGVVAAESAELGGQVLEVPEVRPHANRPRGEYPYP